MNSGFYPIVLSHKQRIQTDSQQIPFYFGGSSVPNNLDLSPKQYSGSGLKKKAQNIDVELFEKHYMTNTPTIYIPDKVVSISDKGKIKLVDTLTKTNNLKKIKGKHTIKLEGKPGNIRIASQGELFETDDTKMGRKKREEEEEMSRKKRQEARDKYNELRKQYDLEYHRYHNIKDKGIPVFEPGMNKAVIAKAKANKQEKLDKLYDKLLERLKEIGPYFELFFPGTKWEDVEHWFFDNPNNPKYDI